MSTAIDRLHALLLAITAPDGCELEGDDLDAYLAQCLELSAAARRDALPVSAGAGQ